MEKVQHKAQACDSPSQPGTSLLPKFNINAIPNDIVLARSAKLGVSLGASPSQVDSSVNLLKDVDLHRTLIMLKRKKASVNPDDPGSLVLNEAYKNSEDLLAEELIDMDVHKERLVKVVIPLRAGKQNNKATAGSVVRRSNRLNKKSA